MSGKAKVRIEGEDATAAAWRSAVSRAKHGADEIGHSFHAAFAGVSLAAIAEVGLEAIKMGDELKKASEKAGIGGKAMSELAYAAKLADIDLSSLSTGIKKMQVALSQANSGGKEQIQTLAALGLKISDIIALKPDKQFELLADRISQLKDPADRARAATELFGKAGADLLPLFAEGAEGIAKARAEAEKLGVSFSDEQIQKLADAEDAMKKLNASWQGFVTTLTASVAPALTTALNFWSGAPRTIYEQVADMEDRITAAQAARGAGSGTAEKSKKVAELRAQLAALREEAKAESLREMGVGGERPSAAHGFNAQTAAEAAAKAAKDQQKEEQKWHDIHWDLVTDLNKQVNDLADETLKNDMEREVARDDALTERYDKWKKEERELALYRQEQSQKTADFFKNTVLSAFDDMVNGTKIKWSEMLKYLALEFARAEIAKGLDSLFSGPSSKKTSSAKGGLLSAVGDFFGSIFGGPKAAGGSVDAGKTYLVGERGRELFRPNTSGSIVPNGALSGGSTVISINPVYHINNPDNTARLPAILRENNRRLVESLSRSGALREQ